MLCVIPLQGLGSFGGDDGWGDSSELTAAQAQLEQQQQELASTRAELESAVKRADELQQQVSTVQPIYAHGYSFQPGPTCTQLCHVQPCPNLPSFRHVIVKACILPVRLLAVNAFDMQSQYRCTQDQAWFDR